MTVELMIEIIKKAHEGQVDKGGAPYHLHPLAVAERVRRRHPEDEELYMIALGHDLFEDTYVTAQFLRDLGFSERVIDGIQALTKIEGQKRKQYEAGVLANIDAAHVKLADLEENMDLSRLPEVTDRDLRRNENYARFHAKITQCIEEFEAGIEQPRP